MAVRVGQTRHAARPLLKIVRGKVHAGPHDHEEAPQQENVLEDFDADPVSSDGETLRPPPKHSKPTQSSRDNDDALRPPPKHSKSTQSLKSDTEDTLRPPPKHRKHTESFQSDNEDALKKPPGSNRKRKADAPLPGRETDPEQGLRKPKAARPRITAVRAPRSGQFEQSRAAKEELHAGKAGASTTHTPPLSSQGNDWGLNPLLLASSQSSQGGRRKDYSSKSKTSNIHAALPATKPSKGPVKFGTKSNKPKTPVEYDSDEDDNVSMMTDPWDEEAPEPEPEDPELRKVPRKKKKEAQTNGDTLESSAVDGTELANLLKPTLREQLGLTDDSYSSLPASSAPQEDMDTIDSYVRDLPAEADEDAACPICHERVDQESYWAFWKGRSKTVKNQATFCHTHREASARAEYAAEGYPPIDWAALSSRIKKHRMELYTILTGDAPSPYRARYAPLALTGKAAAAPSKRRDLSPSQQNALASCTFDDAAVYPGYYGPRGRRHMTEAVMALLHTPIAQSRDPVVQTSGPATFVQAVLVPEVAVRLIMEDLQCDRDAADEVREKTYEMGMLLHEEVEDEVLVGDDEDEGEGEGDNEYRV